jgi:transcriptional regulator with XRE-family HTH domain
MADLKKLVGEQLRKHRKKKGLAQAEVAERTGIVGMGKSRISEIEHGQANITLDTLERVMNALELTPNELFSFHTLSGQLENEEKKLIVDTHSYVLMERGLDEIKYVVQTTKQFLDTIDAIESKSHKK